MRNSFIVSVLMMLFVGLASAGEINYNFHLDTVSQYVYRGAQIEQNMVFQPNVTASKNDVTVGVWANMNTLTRRPDEVDAFANVTKTLGKVTGTLGFQSYHVFDVFNSYEFNLLLSHADIANVNLFSVYDFHSGNGLYEELSYTPKLNVLNTQFLLAVAVAYNHHYWRPARGFSHVYASLAWPIKLSDTSKITPIVYQQEPISNDFHRVTTVNLSLDYGF